MKYRIVVICDVDSKGFVSNIEEEIAEILETYTEEYSISVGTALDLDKGDNNGDSDKCSCSCK